MAIKYEYNSECCGHFYIETRMENDPQVVTKCNVCGQGNYAETNRTEIETIAEPVYVASEDQEVLIEEEII